MYYPALCDFIKDVDLLYHEATFAKDCEALAKKTKHSTAKQAAQIAKEANVKQLILGHYSGRYKDVAAFKTEGEEVFNNTDIAEAGKVFTVN